MAVRTDKQADWCHVTISQNGAVTNTGRVAGQEVVQVYVQDPRTLPFVPYWKRMLGFARTPTLARGAKATVNISLEVWHVLVRTPAEASVQHVWGFSSEHVLPFYPDLPPSQVQTQWREFMQAHPFWLEDGDSPYDDFDGLPAPWPDWCAMGAGNAEIRVGECSGSECS